MTLGSGRGTRTQLSLTILGFAVLAAGCSAATMPSREGSTSERVIWAYFSNEAPSSRFDYVECPRYGGRAPRCGQSVEGVTFPPRVTEFDPAHEENVHFFTMVKGPTRIEKREIEFRADIAGPRGQRWEYSRTVQTDQSTRFPERVDYWTALRVPTRDMAGSPGVWTLFLSIDGEPAGSYPFLLGDPATIAKIKEGFKQSIEIAKSLAAPAQGRLDLSGPAGAKVQVIQQGTAVTTSVLDPSGKLTLPLAVGAYDVEVTQPGFQPWRESITVSEQELQISRSVTLRPR